MHLWISFLDISRVYFWCNELWHGLQIFRGNPFQLRRTLLSTCGMFQREQWGKAKKVTHTQIFQPFVAFKANFELYVWFFIKQENFYHFNPAKIVEILVNSLNIQLLFKLCAMFVFINSIPRFFSPKYSKVRSISLKWQGISD